MRYAGFFVMIFLVGESLSFFATADDIDDGDLSIFEGGVENNGNEFLIVNEYPIKSTSSLQPLTSTMGSKRYF